MQRNTFLSASAIAVLMLGSTLAAHAQVPSLVTPNDTFSYDILGYNTASGTGYFLTNNNIATFGATTTFTGDGIDGQDITVASSEAIGATTTTDTFTISTPTNFINETSVNGLTITGLEFDLGNANSGSDPVNLLLPVASYTAIGKSIYNTNSSITLTPGTTLGTGNTSYSAVEGLQAGTTAITGFKVHSFTYAITYSNVPVAAPEPSAWAGLVIGSLGLGLLGLRAYKRRLDDAFGSPA